MKTDCSSKNSNKYYVIQILKKSKSYYFHTRYGRVGSILAINTDLCSSLEAATKCYHKKYKDKTSGIGYIPIEMKLGKEAAGGEVKPNLVATKSD